MPKKKPDQPVVCTSLDATRTVKKSNLLNEMRNANASMVEYRLFCVYLAHLSLSNESNEVTFKLADYSRIVGLDRPRRTDLVSQAQNLVSKTALLDSPDGGFEVYSIFKKFKLYQDDGEWFVSLECNPDLAPMIREQRGRFLRYKLYNTIYLKSFNQQRIYELLKQYERIGERTIPLKDLREYLSIGKDEYPVWYDFSSKVLKVAQKAIREKTDICFDYEPIRKGRKVIAVAFGIKKNPDFQDQLEIDSFLPPAAIDYEDGEIEVEADPNQLSLDDLTDQAIEFYRDALPPGLTDQQVDLLRSLATDHVAQTGPLPEQELQIFHYLQHKTQLMQATPGIDNPFAWLKKAVAEDWT